MMIQTRKRKFKAAVGRPFRIASLVRIQSVARLKPCPTYKKQTKVTERPHLTGDYIPIYFA